MQQEKIIVSPAIAVKVLAVLKSEKEALEEKVLDLECEIEELEKSLANPVEKLEKKANDFTLTAKRVLASISKHSGLTSSDLAGVIAVDLQLDTSNFDLVRRLKSCISAHISQLKKKDLIVSEYVQEQAANVYFPASIGVPA